MSAAHTPGPWEIVSPNPSIGLQIVGSHTIVAAVPKLFDEPWAEANTRLIAAAPDLLEVLQMVKEAAIEMRGDDFNLTTDQWAKFHAAIAKATGAAR